VSDTLSAPALAPVDHPCGHPSCPGAAAGYVRLLAAHTSSHPLLTPAGESFVRGLLQVSEGGEALPAPSGPPAPRWDGDARCLWLGDRLLKVFRQHAPYQTALLAAFEEGGWAAGYVDDPLPPERGDGPDDARKRLRETVHNLNQGLPPGTIRFRGNGTGEGVRWEWSEADPADRSPAQQDKLRT